MPLFGRQKCIELGHVSQVANFWLSSHNFGEVAEIKKKINISKIKESMYGILWSHDLLVRTINSLVLFLETYIQWVL